MPRSTLTLLVLVLCGCIRVPQPMSATETPLLPDASVRAELSSEGALLRPPTGVEYTGPEVAPEPAGDAGEGQAAAGDAQEPVSSPAPTGGDATGADAGTARSASPWHRPSRSGQVVLSEIMVNPEVVSDAEGEWFELHNPSASEGFELGGCSIDDGSAKPHALPAPLLLAPGAYAAVGRSAQVGFSPRALLTFSLSNAADTLALLCDGVEIDRVAYDSSFPIAAGASMALDPACADASCNDRSGAWCLGRVDYGAGLGTPGAANPPCVEPADADGGLP